MAEIHNLETDADHAFFSGEIQTLIVTFYENERPLSGLAGLMDWRFQGEISDYIRNGIISGAVGQCAYVPITRNNQTYHLLLVGCGASPAPGQRLKPPAEATHALVENISHLNLKKVGISRSDFGNSADDYFSKLFTGTSAKKKGPPLWIVQ